MCLYISYWLCAFIFACTVTLSALISGCQQLYGGHAMLSDVLIQHIGLIQDFIDRVLQVQDSGLIMPVKGVGS